MAKLLWGVSIGLVVLTVLGLVLLSVNTSQAEQLELKAQQAQRALKTMRTPAPEMIQMTDELSRTLRAITVIQTLQPSLAAKQRDWTAIVEALLNYDRQRLSLTDLFQDRNTLTVGGLALSEDDVLSYANALDRSGVFEQVIVQSMESFTLPTPTAAATVTGTAVLTLTMAPTAQVTPTPTASPYDAYETDDFQATAIVLGEVQWHNFNPPGDVDQVIFLGKAGRRYCIQALPQAIGVDTFLEVTVAGAGLTNDDCHPGEATLLACACPTGTVTGSLASLVEIQIPGATDQQVRVRVSNRGQYGPDKWYTLAVYEATGDAYERDDQTPKPIAIGEAQARSFYPAGDVDRVYFPVKAGHAYELRTTNLALGVDTVIVVQVDGVTQQNDDAASGDPSSRLLFKANADGTAQVTITNKGLYGVDKTYTLQLLEAGGDAYEPDDQTPRPLSPYEGQRHTFFPLGDVDRVYFPVKAGRVYEVKTYSLTLGVDTVLEVLVEGQTLRNDDIAPGDYASRVILTPSRDGVAIATLTNRGEYGVDKEYWLTLRELAGTPTRDLTRQPLTPGPTPTVFCGDSYEPDDIVGRLAVVNQEQGRNFCPNGDVDKAVFTAKAGYSYIVETYDLAPGVDTVVTVLLGGQSWTSDDRSPQDLSSKIIFQNQSGRDAPAFITITNKGLFGQNRTYKFKVSDAGTGDAYEVDDLSPVPIAFGIGQARSFYPPGDVDRVYFVAKVNHRYRIYTQGLAPGVDTVLTVNMGALQLRNDDRQPGDLSSYVELQNDGASDVQATVLVTNNGQYGPDKTYTLVVEFLGVVRTPTPDLTRTTATPTPLFTPGPTATPGPSSTPTLDCGDAFEPDDAVARVMGVNEEQPRTFCPAGDVDQVVFTAKAGYSYAVETTALATGADSVLTVRLGSQVWTSDDRSPQDLSSRVVFQNQTGADAPAFVTVTNKGLFGPNRTYVLRVTDVGSGDAYEVDDLAPVPIAIGAGQARSFYPPGDVDRVYFTAKAERRYRIYTRDLAPGVDTMLTVDMGTTHLSNDDKIPGDLSSYVELQNDGPDDLEATVQVTNKGQYGPDKTYVLQVDDLGTESGDAYEPDLTVKRYLSINESQRHTFHPALDVDQVTLLVKAGRRYMVVTCGNGLEPGSSITVTTPFSPTQLVCDPLTPGVDTVLVVTGPVHNCQPSGCQSDDALPGTGYLNSAVIFEATADGEVTITIYNKGLFGPTMEYYLRAYEVGLVTAWAPLGQPQAVAWRREGAPLLQGIAWPAPRRWWGLAAPPERPAAQLAPLGAAPGAQLIQFTLQLRLKTVTP